MRDGSGVVMPATLSSVRRSRSTDRLWPAGPTRRRSVAGTLVSLPPRGERDQMASLALSFDVGGTFTDFVTVDLDTGTFVGRHKVLTNVVSPHGPSSRLAGAGRVRNGDAADIALAVHSTTLVTNALIERKGAPTVLLATRGFRDILELGREQMYDIYDLFAPPPEPLIPRPFRLEIDERIDADGAGRPAARRRRRSTRPSSRPRARAPSRSRSPSCTPTCNPEHERSSRTHSRRRCRMSRSRSRPRSRRSQASTSAHPRSPPTPSPARSCAAT